MISSQILRPLAAMLLTCSATLAAAQQQSFQIIKDGEPAELCVSANADKGVVRAVNSLASDIEAVCGTRPAIVNAVDASRPQVVIGQLDDEMFRAAAVDASQLRDSTEKHLIITEPQRLSIAGADKRGVIYGIYTLSERLGGGLMSPWRTSQMSHCPLARRRRDARRSNTAASLLTTNGPLSDGGASTSLVASTIRPMSTSSNSSFA